MLPLSHGNYQQYLTVNTSFISLTSQQIRNVEPMLVYRWASVADAGPTLNQRRD